MGRRVVHELEPAPRSDGHRASPGHALAGGRPRCDKRAILDFYGRADTPYVTDSIRDLRTEVNGTLTALGPDAASRPLLARVRTAIHEYLTAVEADHDQVLFGAALRDLRTIIRDVAMQGSSRARATRHDVLDPSRRVTSSEPSRPRRLSSATQPHARSSRPHAEGHGCREVV
jgi:hypothetical protein